MNTSFSELYHANGSSNGYDNLNQLVAFSRGTLNGSNDTISSPSASETWTTDAAGNFTSAAGTSETNNKQNEATAFGSATLTYDANGNLTTDQAGNTLVYDAWNRLVAYKNGGTTLETLSYDGRDRLIVQNAGTATDLYYSDQWQVLEERQGSTVTAHYVWSPLYVDTLVLRDRSTGGGTLNERLWVQQDANWNVTALVNGSGVVQERYVYDPYGVTTYLNASWGTLTGSAYAWIYGHQGGRWDGTTGLYYFEHRGTSAALQRWTQEDPSGFSGGDTNLYRDLANRPTSALDSTGLFINPCQTFPDNGHNSQWNQIQQEKLRSGPTKEDAILAGGALLVIGLFEAPALLGAAASFFATHPEVESRLPAVEAELPAVEAEVPAVEAELPAITQHGALRLADPTRLNEAEIAAAKLGHTLQQAGGGTVYIQQVKPGKFNVYIENAAGQMITSVRHLDPDAVKRLAMNYGWTAP